MPSFIYQCPLCGSSHCGDYYRDNKRIYLNCRKCSLIFVPQEYHLVQDEEKKVYDLHQNNLHDPGYRRFLSRLATPLLKRITPGERGLDFGCGPGPALCTMLEERGMLMAKYDLFYYPDISALRGEYDFVCSTEVVEHLKDPAAAFKTLFSLLKQKGTLAIMTKMVTSPKAFSRWHYIQDQTHICFYSKETFISLAASLGGSVKFVDKDVIFFMKL